MNSARLNTQSKIFWLGLFGLTMGYFEAAVVEYLRSQFYPEGFAFPLKNLPTRMLLIELGREIASILMLAAAGGIAGACFLDRFAGVMFSFGVWDITYYLWLRLFENWPASPATVDLLFLIPLPWVGPVWAPLGVSIVLIVAAVVFWKALDRGEELRLERWEWLGEVSAGGIIVFSFLWGARQAMRKETLPDYPWYLWLIGMTAGVIIFWRAVKRSRRRLESK